MKTYPKTCPACGTNLTAGDSIRTDELIPGTCYAFVDDGGGLEFDGHTRVCWDGQETTAVFCADCDARIDDDDPPVIESVAALVDSVAGDDPRVQLAAALLRDAVVAATGPMSPGEAPPVPVDVVASMLERFERGR